MNAHALRTSDHAPRVFIFKKKTNKNTYKILKPEISSGKWN